MLRKQEYFTNNDNLDDPSEVPLKSCEWSDTLSYLMKPTSLSRDNLSLKASSPAQIDLLTRKSAFRACKWDSSATSSDDDRHVLKNTQPRGWQPGVTKAALDKNSAILRDVGRADGMHYSNGIGATKLHNDVQQRNERIPDKMSSSGYSNDSFCTVVSNVPKGNERNKELPPFPGLKGRIYSTYNSETSTSSSSTTVVKSQRKLEVNFCSPECRKENNKSKPVTTGDENKKYQPDYYRGCLETTNFSDFGTNSVKNELQIGYMGKSRVISKNVLESNDVKSREKKSTSPSLMLPSCGQRNKTVSQKPKTEKIYYSQTNDKSSKNYKSGGPTSKSPTALRRYSSNCNVSHTRKDNRDASFDQPTKEVKSKDSERKSTKERQKSGQGIKESVPNYNASKETSVTKKPFWPKNDIWPKVLSTLGFNSTPKTEEQDTVCKKCNGKKQKHRSEGTEREEGKVDSMVGGGLKETRWAFTQVNIFTDGSKTYTVGKPTKDKPAQMPTQTDRVFVTRKKNQQKMLN